MATPLEYYRLNPPDLPKQVGHGPRPGGVHVSVNGVRVLVRWGTYKCSEKSNAVPGIGNSEGGLLRPEIIDRLRMEHLPTAE